MVEPVTPWRLWTASHLIHAGENPRGSIPVNSEMLKKSTSCPLAGVDQFPFICTKTTEGPELCYTPRVLTSDTTILFPVHPREVVLKSKADIRKEVGDSKQPKNHHGLTLLSP